MIFICALSWSMVMAEISFKKSLSLNRVNNSLRKDTFGKLWFRLLKVWTHCIDWIFCIEILKVRTFFCLTKMDNKTLSLEIWMYLKWLNKNFCILKLELLTMQVLKFGKTILTIHKVMYGLWAAWFTKCVH